MRPNKLKLLPALIGLACAAGLTSAHADERESLEALRQTTLSLIQTLVDSGVLTKEKAEALLAQAKERAATATAAAQPAAAASSVRVPYVPQVVRDQIRNEIKEEVLAQAREERWGVPNAKADWTEHIKIDGDLRLRHQLDQFGNGNPTGTDFIVGAFTPRGTSTFATRAPDFATFNSAGVANANTTEDRSRTRLRLRLGVTGKVTDGVTAGVRLATGSATDRVSTNQTLGQDFNKYTLYVDRAYVKLDPVPWFSFSGGRIPNPWFSTDLVWSENLNFEGVAATAKWPGMTDPSFAPFLTVGAFPVREDTGSRRGRWLRGAQLGLQWQPDPAARLKFGLARYSYAGIEGQVDDDYDTSTLTPGATYGRYEYGSGLRQKGNTVFATNNPADPSATVYWGLASKFEPLALTVAGEFSWFNPVMVMFSADFVTNTAFDRNEIFRRTGLRLEDGSKTGTLLRVAFGASEVRAKGDWQASLTWRRLGSDAVLDGFTDSDFGLGGTNNKGYVLGFTYGLDKDLNLALRYLSSRTIDSPRVLPGTDDTFKVNSLQVDLNVRF
jgi:hypothetical protein